MQPYRDTVLTMINGKLTPVSGASVLVKEYPGLATATIYSDNGVTAATNPLTTDARGAYTFFAADGRYQLVISGTGFDTITIPQILLEDPADVATARLLGRVTAGTGAAEALTGTQATTLLDAFTSGLKGLVPASGGGTANFLRADGAWAAAGGGGGGGATTGTVSPYLIGDGAAGSGTYPGWIYCNYSSFNGIVFFTFEMGWSAHTGSGELQMVFPSGFPELAAGFASVSLYRPNWTTSSGVVERVGVSTGPGAGESTLRFYSGEGTAAGGYPAVVIDTNTSGSFSGSGWAFAL